MWCSSFVLSHYFLWCNQAPVWVAGMGPGQDDRPKVMTSLWPWKAALPLKYLSQIQADLLPFHLLFLLLLFSIFLLWLFLPEIALPFPPYLVLISKAKCLQMTLLLAFFEAKPKCHLGCQALLHMSMVHPRSECSWVIEHCTAAAVKCRTCYLKKTPILVITDLILVTHQYALPFYVKLPRRSSHKMKHTQKNTLKGFCWAIWWFGKCVESLVIWQFCSYENKGSINLVLLQQCEVWRQIGTKLDLKSPLLLMLFWTGGGFWGVHERWKVLDQPLHFGGKRNKLAMLI